MHLILYTISIIQLKIPLNITNIHDNLFTLNNDSHIIKSLTYTITHLICTIKSVGRI
jgi:hypothetical protein